MVAETCTGEGQNLERAREREIENE